MWFTRIINLLFGGRLYFGGRWRLRSFFLFRCISVGRGLAFLRSFFGGFSFKGLGAGCDLRIDGFFHLAAKVFLRAMVRSIIQWINSGFQGAPAFVTDLRGFLVDVADEIAGEFIYQSDALRFLCSPFQLDVRIALAGTYSRGPFAWLTVRKRGFPICFA